MPSAGFADTAGNPHAPSIDCIAWYGITLGTGAAGSQPRYSTVAAVSRGQMASFVARLLAEGGVAVPSAPTDAFGDDDGSVHEDNINALAELGVVQGTGATTADGRGVFSPLRAVTRAQMASFVARDLDLLTDGGFADPGGAVILLDATAVDGRFAGTVLAHKRLASLTLAGCGQPAHAAPVDTGGRFSVAEPSHLPAEGCVLTVTPTTRSADGHHQTVDYTFAFHAGQ